MGRLVVCRVRIAKLRFADYQSQIEVYMGRGLGSNSQRSPRHRENGIKKRKMIFSQSPCLPWWVRVGYLYSAIFLMYSATASSTNRPSGFPFAAAARIAVAETGW